MAHLQRRCRQRPHLHFLHFQKRSDQEKVRFSFLRRSAKGWEPTHRFTSWRLTKKCDSGREKTSTCSTSRMHAQMPQKDYIHRGSQKQEGNGRMASNIFFNELPDVLYLHVSLGERISPTRIQKDSQTSSMNSRSKHLQSLVCLTKNNSNIMQTWEGITSLHGGVHVIHGAMECTQGHLTPKTSELEDRPKSNYRPLLKEVRRGIENTWDLCYNNWKNNGYSVDDHLCDISFHYYRSCLSKKRTRWDMRHLSNSLRRNVENMKP